MTDDDSDAGPETSPVEFDPASGSFDEFFRRSYEPVARGLILAIGDVELGRDAAAEGFARALPRWRKIAGYRNPAGWVYRVGLNWAISRRRRTRRESLVVVDERTSGAARPVADPDPELLAAIRALDVDQRAVVVARFYLDWSEADIAAALQIRPGTVKSRLSRALDRLAAELGSTRSAATSARGGTS